MSNAGNNGEDRKVYPFRNLFTPYKIGNLTIKNRFSVAPMGIYMYGAKGDITEEGAQYLVERAKGGFGLIFTWNHGTDTEIDSFSMLERISPFSNQKNYVRSSIAMNDRIHVYGSKVFAQISMGNGRMANNKSASEVMGFFDPTRKCDALTIDEIKRKIGFVVQAAAVCKKAGYDGVEIHAMHWGYLLDQFAMSLINKRTDEYGGTLENRMRCAKEIVQGIKQLCGSDFPVSMRLGLKSYIKGLGRGNSSLTGEDEAGRTLEEGLEICKLLEKYGYDVLNTDVGMYESMYYAAAPMYMKKGYVIPLAAEAKKVVDIPVLTCGRMDDPYMAEEAIAEGKLDGIVLGRASLADPQYPKKVEMGKLEKIRPCIACNQGCLGYLFKTGAIGGCAVNPAAMRELNYGIEKSLNPKKVAVVGGGISGMEAARIAKMRGNEVVLYEKSDKLGGNLLPAGVHTFKRDVHSLNDWYKTELRDLDIPVEFYTDVSPEVLKKAEVDIAILAVGSVPIKPRIPGIDNSNVLSSTDALMGNKKIGEKVIVVGGGLVGCEIALEYAMEGKDVTIVEAKDAILSAGPAVPWMNTMMLNDLLEHHKVKILTSSMLSSINNDGIVITSTDEEKTVSEIEADTIVIAIGYKPLPSMVQDLYGSGIEVYETGDGKQVGNILTSIWDAYEVARGHLILY